MTGYIDDKGKYIKGKDKPMLHNISSQWKSWSHMEQRKRFSRDIVQPYIGGKVNREFVESFPEESKIYFKENEIINAERDLGGLNEQ